MSKLNTRPQTTKKKTWPKVCMILALVMIVFAGALYVIQGVNLTDEFGFTKDYYGAAYSELFRLTTPKKEMQESVLAQANEAFAFIGTEAEAKERFGELAGYCAILEREPEAATVDYTLDLIAGKTEKDSGYLWVAYTYRLYDAEGELLTASGSEDSRVLSRWTVKKTADGWTVTEIKEHP